MAAVSIPAAEDASAKSMLCSELLLLTFAPDTAAEVAATDGEDAFETAPEAAGETMVPSFCFLLPLGRPLPRGFGGALGSTTVAYAAACLADSSSFFFACKGGLPRGLVPFSFLALHLLQCHCEVVGTLKRGGVRQ